MPAHTSHILQPLDVGVFRSLKAAWRAELQSYKVKNLSAVPTRFDFNKFLTPVYEKCFTPSNIRSGFNKAGIHPLNRNAISSEAIKPSTLSDLALPEEVCVDKDYDEEIAHSQINRNDIDPLNETEVKEIGVDGSSIPSTSKPVPVPSLLPNKAPFESLEMECESEPISKTSNDSPGSIPSNKKILIHDVLSLRKWKPSVKKRQNRTVPKAQCLTPVATTSKSLSSGHPTQKYCKKEDLREHILQPNQDNIPKPRKHGPVNKKQTSKLLQRSKPSVANDEWVCLSCNGLYSQDVKLKNGANWITCSFCTRTYHTHCQSQEISDNQQVYMCDWCSVDHSSGEE